MATFPSRIMVLTSAKSILMYPEMVMISAIAFAALVSTSSALANAFDRFKSGKIFLSFSLFITSMASTYSLRATTPSSAWRIFTLPSKAKGMVTIPTVSIPMSCAVLATMGDAPVPVPPPMPAVINTILVLSANIVCKSATDSSAARRATSGRPPAPSPCVMFFPS